MLEAARWASLCGQLSLKLAAACDPQVLKISTPGISQLSHFAVFNGLPVILEFLCERCPEMLGGRDEVPILS